MVHTNRLAREKSPYLLQHANNPVDWYPWGAEAFQAAHRTDRPIFLSIGYSSCHWCHVMSRECFEDEDVARVLNRDFISIKVDREERPEIDEIYMKVCQMMTGSGGWPLTIVMTPDRVPFFAATYIPRVSKGGITGMLDILPALTKIWEHDRDDVEKVTNDVLAHLNARVPDAEKWNIDDFDQKVFEGLLQSYEVKYGGFEIGPKFPTPHKLMFLLRQSRWSGDVNGDRMALWTLRCMAMGGVHDHVGGGFHRYSTDGRWLLPHFEKMLYDQAMLAMAYDEAFLKIGRPWMRRVALRTIRYPLRRLSAPGGGFYSSEDADSQGVEGRFYTWTRDEVVQVLGHDDATRFCIAFDVRQGGNHRSSSGTYDGSNVLHLTEEMTTLAERWHCSVEEVRMGIEAGLLKLFGHREGRARPDRDEKILLDWNGLMIAALAKVGRSNLDGTLLDRAKAVVDFIEREMRGDGGALLHRYKEGEASITAFLTDHAFYGWGLLEMHQATMDERYLELAKVCADDMISDLSHPAGGFYLSQPDPHMIARSREIYDGAVPSGNSVAHLLLNRLAVILEDGSYSDIAKKSESSFSHNILSVPEAHAFLGMSMGLARRGYSRVGLSGKSQLDEDVRRNVGQRFLPHVVLAHTEGDSPTISVCQNSSCLPPMIEVEQVLRTLEKGGKDV